MPELLKFILIYVSGVLVSSFSQILLKKSADQQHKKAISEYLNSKVIIAYVMFFTSTFLSMYSLKVVPLNYSPIIESLGYIFIPVLSFLMLKEKITKRQLLGTVVIFVGIFIYSI